ncbi:MAG: hypothetical protein P1V97_28950 [Planctomycetota bacterium]|nr:hypothetical protein [Planctomycetota bacterium]
MVLWNLSRWQRRLVIVIGQGMDVCLPLGVSRRLFSPYLNRSSSFFPSKRGLSVDRLIRQQQRRASISYDDRAQAAILSRDFERVGQLWDGQTLSSWLNQLMASTAKERLTAVHALGKIGPAAYEATAQLERRLHAARRHERELRAAVFESLSLILREGALPLFSDLLEHKDEHIRAGAAEALPLLGSEGLAVLERALDNLDPRIRVSACNSLHNLPAPFRGRLLRRLVKDPWPYCRLRGMETLASLGVQDSGLRLEEIHSFILSEFKSPHHRNRSVAARAMGWLGSYSKVVFDAAHESADPRVRLLALRFSQDLPEERIDQLTVKMRRENFQFRKEVVRAVVRLPNTNKEGLLEKVFWLENRVMQINIVLALGGLGTPKALETIRSLYDTKHMRVKVQVLEALARLSARDQSQLSSQNSACLSLFEKALKSHRTEIVRGSIRALGYWRMAGALGLIGEALGHSNRSVRQTVLTTLAAWESCPERTALLQRIRRDSVPIIASQASLLMRPPL